MVVFTIRCCWERFSTALNPATQRDAPQIIPLGVFQNHRSSRSRQNVDQVNQSDSSLPGDRENCDHPRESKKIDL